MHAPQKPPTVVLICHRRIASTAKASRRGWRARCDLAGLIVIADTPRAWRAARRESARGGSARLLDVAAFRVYARLRLAPQRTPGKTRSATAARALPGLPRPVPTDVVVDPNCDEARDVPRGGWQPDLVIARCKFILNRRCSSSRGSGPSRCIPESAPSIATRTAVSGRWRNRDLDRVGMTLLRIDRGIDTGPVLLQATCPFDEVRESHMSSRAESSSRTWTGSDTCYAPSARGQSPPPIDTTGRTSAVWGQPRLTTLPAMEARRSPRSTEARASTCCFMTCL